MTFKGIVKEIVFRNDENGYTVAVLGYEKGQVTTVGIFPPITEGHYLSVEGNFVNHAAYGQQFKATSVKFDKPDSRVGMILFLGSGLISGIGQKRAELIVNAFGEDTFKVIETQPSMLASIKGISKRLADEISDSYIKVSNVAEAITFLADNGVSTNLAMKVIAVYGEQTISKVTINPYALIEDVTGIGFLTADKISNKIGIDFESPFRIKAGIYHVLSEFADKTGNTAVPMVEVIEQTRGVLSFDNSQIIEEHVDALILNRRIKKVVCDDVDALMLMSYYNAEKLAAAKINKLIYQWLSGYTNWEDKISRFERMNDIHFHDCQKEAITAALSSGVCVITGGPGTGKTTIIRCLTSILGECNYDFKLMAPTGRAARRLGEASGQPAMTIHRALMGEDEFATNVIIVDEFSMVDVMLLKRMMEAMHDGCRLVIVGDSDQLPSVGAGNVLYDILASGVVPVVRLTQIFRQEDCGKIIMNAHAVNNGHMPDLGNASKDFFFINAESSHEVSTNVLQLVSKRLPKYLNCDPRNIQVLSPMKNGEAGCINLNAQLQDILISSTQAVKVGEIMFHVGDKVMHTVNNYNLEWRKGIDTGKGVFNGDIGYVTNISVQRNQIEVLLEDGRAVLYAGEDKSQLMLAYAITVHKSQGSEYEGVVIALSGNQNMIMTRNLLYTAITRAKNMVVVVGSEKTISYMVRNNFIKKRYSMLKALLVEEKKKQEFLYSLPKGNEND